MVPQNLPLECYQWKFNVHVWPILIPTMEDEKTGKHTSSTSAKEVNTIYENQPVSSAGIPGKLDGHAVSTTMITTLELRNPTNLNTNYSSTSLQHTCSALPSEAWSQVRSAGRCISIILLIIL